LTGLEAPWGRLTFFSIKKMSQSFLPRRSQLNFPVLHQRLKLLPVFPEIRPKIADFFQPRLNVFQIPMVGL
jgi:hypothetical protein